MHFFRPSSPYESVLHQAGFFSDTISIVLCSCNKCVMSLYHLLRFVGRPEGERYASARLLCHPVFVSYQVTYVSETVKPKFVSKAVLHFLTIAWVSDWMGAPCDVTTHMVTVRSVALSSNKSIELLTRSDNITCEECGAKFTDKYCNVSESHCCCLAEMPRNTVPVDPHIHCTRVTELSCLIPG
jgi:hypothetical protein